MAVQEKVEGSSVISAELAKVFEAQINAHIAIDNPTVSEMWVAQRDRLIRQLDPEQRAWLDYICSTVKRANE